MAGIVIRNKNSGTGNTTLYGATNAPSKYLAIHDGTRAYYVPVVTSGGSVTIGNTKYSYSSSKPSFAVYDGSQILYLANTETTVTTTYDIPAGTYSPSRFENLIRSFISNNGSRKVSNSFSVVVNGQTYNVPAGRAVCYTYQYGGQARFVSFNGSQRGGTAFQNSNAFTQYGIYCTYWSYSTIQGNMYNNFSIKVNTGIKFS